MMEAWLSSSLITASSAVNSASKRPACAEGGQRRDFGVSLARHVARRSIHLCKAVQCDGRTIACKSQPALAAARATWPPLTLASKHEGYRMVSSVP